MPAGPDGKPAGAGTGTPVAPRGVEAKGAQSRTQVAGTDGLRSGAWVSFDTTTRHQVTMKVALSYVSQDGATANLAAEDPGWSVPAVAKRTYAQWNSLLSRMRIGGGTAAERQEFYTALYHTMLEPSLFSDANGDYLGFDGKVHRTARGKAQYANFSGWDIYRSEIPLLAVIAPEQTSQMMTSLLNDQAQGGWLPKWGFADDYTDVMNGDAADPMLAEAYALGARDFDAKAALAAMVKGATVVPASPAEHGPGLVRRAAAAVLLRIARVRTEHHAELPVAGGQRRLGDHRVRHRRLRHRPARQGARAERDVPDVPGAVAELDRTSSTPPPATSSRATATASSRSSTRRRTGWAASASPASRRATPPSTPGRSRRTSTA